MSWLDGIGSATLGLIGGLTNSAMSLGMQKDLMKYQAKLNYKYGRKSALNQYTWQRTGLENAGFNPLLAVSSGAEGVANTGWTSAGSADSPDITNNALQALANKRENKIANAQVRNADADTENKRANNGLIAQQIVGQQLQNAFYTRQKESEIALNNAEQFLKMSQFQEILKRLPYIENKEKATIYNLLQQGKSAINSSYAQLRSVEQQEPNYDFNKRYKEWGDKHPFLRNFDETMQRYFSPVASAGIGYMAATKAPKTNKSSSAPKMRSKVHH